MDSRHKYLVTLFDNIFTHGLAQFDIEESGYIEFDEDILAILPCHQDIQKIMSNLQMKTIKFHDTEIVIYGGKYNKNWAYSFFDADDIGDVFNRGTFRFEMALDGEWDEQVETFRTQVECVDFQIDNIFIDTENEDVWLIKDGEYI